MLQLILIKTPTSPTAVNRTEGVRPLLPLSACCRVENCRHVYRCQCRAISIWIVAKVGQARSSDEDTVSEVAHAHIERSSPIGKFANKIVGEVYLARQRSGHLTSSNRSFGHEIHKRVILDGSAVLERGIRCCGTGEYGQLICGFVDGKTGCRARLNAGIEIKSTIELWVCCVIDKGIIRIVDL